MAEIWRTRDHFGRDVVFSSQGRDHILDRHDDMAVHLNEVSAVIEQATTVTRDLNYRHRENFYQRVSTEGTWLGEVVTAYIVKRPDPREEPRSL